MTPPTARPRSTSRPRLTAAALAAAMLGSLTGVLVVGQAAGAQEATPASVSVTMPLPEASASPLASPPAEPADPRPEGTWIATGYDTWGDGLVAPMRGSTLTLSLLPAGRLEGETGCGTYIGGYTVEGEALRIGILSTGGEPCGTRRDEETFRFTQALTTVSRWAPGAAGLELLDDDGRIRVTLERPVEVSPVADWVVRRLARPDRQLAEPLEGSEVSLVLADDGTVAGNTGCRQFQGGYSVEADRIVIAPIVIVGLSCDGSGQRLLQRQDRRLLALLDEAVEWRRSGDSLALSDGSGSLVLELRARPAPVASPAPVATDGAAPASSTAAPAGSASASPAAG